MATKNHIDSIFNAICDAVRNSLGEIENYPGEKKISNKRSIVKQFQNKICDKLNETEQDYNWNCEVQKEGSHYKDSIDIYGEPDSTIIDGLKCVIEIDTTRADQIAKKMLSRFSLFKDEKIVYVPIIYPGTKKMNVPECEKYIRYGYDLIKKINQENNLRAIFLIREYKNGDENNEIISQSDIEIIYPEKNLYIVNHKACKSMAEAVFEATKVYLKENNIEALIKKADEDKLKNHNGLQTIFSVKGLTKDPMIIDKDNNKLYITRQWCKNGKSKNFDKIVCFFKELGIEIKEAIVINGDY